MTNPKRNAYIFSILLIAIKLQMCIFVLTKLKKSTISFKITHLNIIGQPWYS